MAITLFVEAQARALVPLTSHDLELLGTARLGDPYRAVLTTQRPRSVQQNRFYWAVLGIVVDNHPFYDRAEQLHLWLKQRMGYVETLNFHDGSMMVQVTSTAFDRMDSQTFKEFLDHALMILSGEVIPGMVREDLIRETESKLGFTYNAMFQGK